MSALESRIHLGDCIAGMQSLQAESVDLAFADPPFNIGYTYDVYDDRLEAEKYLDWSRDWLSEVVRVLKRDGTFWLAIGDEFAAELKVLMQRELGLSCRSWVIWYYTFGVNCKQKFSRSHAHLLYMVKDPKKFTFNGADAELRVPSARQLVYGDKRANPDGRLPDDTWMIPPEGVPIKYATKEGWVLRPQDLPESFDAEEDTWFYPRVNGTFAERKGWHGCQMPEQVLARVIRACSHPDDVVLDPFTGSGTTLAVAKKLGRRYCGFELSDQYAARAVERLSTIKSGDALDGVSDPINSSPSTDQGRRLEKVDGAKKSKRVKNKKSVQQSLLKDLEATDD